jgi:pyruvate/2-oxoglutarate dehydrogenase complex dihydrolipoamide acyltransferase (E2) component
MSDENFTNEGAPAVDASEADSSVDATAAAEELAAEEGVDLSEVEGSGVEGRVTKPDVEEFLANDGEADEADEEPQPEYLHGDGDANQAEYSNESYNAPVFPEGEGY